MNNFTFQYMKKRRDFGQQPLFCEQGPEVCDSILTKNEDQQAYILRNPVHETTQFTPCYSQHVVNTEKVRTKQTAVNHYEGGWPKDVNLADPTTMERYRRKIEKDDAYAAAVKKLTPGVEHLILQNNVNDLYQSYFTKMEKRPKVKKPSMRTVGVFRDKKQRPANSISWQAENTYNFAVSYVEVNEFNQSLRPVEAFLWDVTNPIEPESIIKPPSVLYDLRYNARDPNLLIGALGSGQVAAWDKRDVSKPSAICPIASGHRDLVRQVMFITSRRGTEFFSGGPDGMCKWWDLRNLKISTDEMIIDVVTDKNDVPRMDRSLAIRCLEFEPSQPARFLVGTMNGFVVCGNRKGKNPADKIPAEYEAHLGPVHSVERNPIFLKNFLTVGDWTVRVWAEECRQSAIIWSPLQKSQFRAGCWSPERMSLITTCGDDGKLSCWDLIRCQHKPVLTAEFPEPLLSEKFHEEGKLLAVGGGKGSVYLVELCKSLSRSEPDDKQLLTAIFERESKRQKISEARLREIKLKWRLKLQMEEEAKEATAFMAVDPTLGDRDLIETSNAYMNTIKHDVAHSIHRPSVLSAGLGITP